ncbi:Oidioi.mRNA.OKI2018_I69.PAR.g12523.t1.cds [Oikopleura dioica]|uniref:Oidioi.mRNA.OKI2018_I69.PAR.g12523.t1.cds n=1 Tax=Oikopleura dioica TaxID=34765 RepID=A0ABN7S4A0_OIKDI|nr:Oidioi.mRNA.OKI2018_I69.PAR.g12523.t1.cds [Oikopleura dioica]
MYNFLNTQIDKISKLLFSCSCLLLVTQIFSISVGVKYGVYFALEVFLSGIAISIVPGIAGWLGITQAKKEQGPDFYISFKTVACVGNFAGSVAVVGFLLFATYLGAVAYSLSTWGGSRYWFGMSHPMKWAYLSMLVIEWFLMTIIMSVSFVLANYFGCTCCCQDPSNSVAIAPVVVQDAPLTVVTVREEPSSEKAEEIQGF